MNKPTQQLVKSGLRAISSTSKNKQTATKVVGSLVSWNGNTQTAVGSTRKKASVASTSTAPAMGGAAAVDEHEEFPMKLAHFIQRRHLNEQQEQQSLQEERSSIREQMSPLQEKWAKLASLTMDPSITQISESLANRQALPQTDRGRCLDRDTGNHSAWLSRDWCRRGHWSGRRRVQQCA